MWKFPLLLLTVAILVAVPADYYVTTSLSPEGNPAIAEELGFLNHVDHIVFVVLENHAYDNYFGTYCLERSALCPEAASGIPRGTCVPYSPLDPFGPCIRPWNFTARNWTLYSHLPHSYNVSHAAWNNGAMNDFYSAEGSGLDPFGHFNGTTAPIYWDLAEEYGLSDSFFSSILSYSLPNHWHIVAGQAPRVIVANGTLGCPTCPGKTVLERDHTYLNESNHTESIEDLLMHSSVSWKYYDYELGSYARAIDIRLNETTNRIISTGTAYNIWNPEAAKAESYNASFVNHFAVNSQFYADAQSGNLPSISWVIPSGQDSDHPTKNSTLAQSWVASLVDAVESSPEWKSTAIYVTWDDYGGFYDNVAPPSFEGQQLGFRVPLLEISPYTPAGTVSHSFAFFESVLHLMEWRFDLGCISVLDCNAPLPIFGFDWNSPPRAPEMFPTNFTEAHYPYASGTNGGQPVVVGGYIPPSQFTTFPDGEEPDVD
jgi:phospholipase C